MNRPSITRADGARLDDAYAQGRWESTYCWGRHRELYGRGGDVSWLVKALKMYRDELLAG